MDDPFHLTRFVQAQDPVYAQVLDQLRAGRKTSHWMWFIFPQLRGLGRSPTADYFSISSRAEARAYLDHPLLGARIRECARLVAALDGRSAAEIFGFPDDVKLKSSMTLFAATAQEKHDFLAVIDKYFQGRHDVQTLDLLGREEIPPST